MSARCEFGVCVSDTELPSRPWVTAKSGRRLLSIRRGRLNTSRLREIPGYRWGPKFPGRRGRDFGSRIGWRHDICPADLEKNCGGTAACPACSAVRADSSVLRLCSHRRLPGSPGESAGPRLRLASLCVRDSVLAGEFTLKKTPPEENIADVLTRAVASSAFARAGARHCLRLEWAVRPGSWRGRWLRGVFCRQYRISGLTQKTDRHNSGTIPFLLCSLDTLSFGSKHQTENQL